MLIINTVTLLRLYIQELHQKNRSIALIPTMGNLHDGHMRLIEEAKKHADVIVVTIFVNPMQFECLDDLESYPYSIQEDCKKLKEHYVSIAFTPSVCDIYKQNIKTTTYIEVPKISNILEGSSRPRHFRGVLTIVSKLFNIIRPNVALFGEKDYQQLILIRKMVSDMDYNIKIISVPIVRDKDGLALSSRNSHLTMQQREIAPNIYKAINIIADNIIPNIFNINELINFTKNFLYKKGFHTNYVKIRDADSLLELTNNSKRAVILIAAQLGKTRLIDNKVIELMI